MQHQERFLALTQALGSLQQFWRESPFYDLQVAWREHWPQLNNACLGLTDNEFDHLDQHPEALAAFLSSYIPNYQALRKIVVEPLNQKIAALEPRLNVGVPGRKWQQLEAFIGALPEKPKSATAHVVDWCSGKSFMGRAAAHHWKCGLHAVERDSTLCHQGEAQAKAWLDDVSFSCRDVLVQQTLPTTFEQTDFVTALHACGDLHRQLIKEWLPSDSRQLAFAPCCYHQWLQPEGYQPLSQLGQTHDLKLIKKQVRLAVQEMVTANRATRCQVRQLGEWRMAFDLLQRDLRGVDEYLPTKSIPYSRVKQGAVFVLNVLAKQKGLTIPAGFDVQPYLAQGKKRYAEYLRLQLVPQGFRRAIELWLVLDLVVLLEEQGCTVDLTCFCPRDITPRNFRILAQR